MDHSDSSVGAKARLYLQRRGFIFLLAYDRPLILTDGFGRRAPCSMREHGLMKKTVCSFQTALGGEGQ